jgi:type III secretory pathway component EscT
MIPFCSLEENIVSILPYVHTHCLGKLTRQCCLVYVAALMVPKQVEKFRPHTSWQLRFRSKWPMWLIC